MNLGSILLCLSISFASVPFIGSFMAKDTGKEQKLASVRGTKREAKEKRLVTQTKGCKKRREDTEKIRRSKRSSQP